MASKKGESVWEGKLETVLVAKLKLHPRNYQQHPQDQLDHIEASLKEFGQYRPVVVAKDYTILAGHGLVKTIRERMEWTHVQVRRIDIEPDSASALRLLVADNRISQLADVDDRALSEVLRDIFSEDNSGLTGTGFDPQMLAALVFVTRPASEIQDYDAAAEWVGMPTHGVSDPYSRLVLDFPNSEERAQFLLSLGVDPEGVGFRTAQGGRVVQARWPILRTDDLSSVLLEA